MSETSSSLSARVEAELSRQAGISAAVEVQDGVVRLNGMVDSAESQQAAADIAAQVAGGFRIDNALEVTGHLPATVDEAYAAEPSSGSFQPLDAVEDLGARGGELEPDFTDQGRLADPNQAMGANGGADDPAADGNDVYTPATDPVVTTDARGQAQVLGGFGGSSTEEIEVDRSASDGRLGDQAIEDAVRRELREDAATTQLPLSVVVVRGVAHIRGHVGGLEDAEAAEEVASRVPGVREVVDETEVAGI